MPVLGRFGSASARSYGRFSSRSLLFPFTAFTFLPVITWVQSINASNAGAGPTLVQMQSAYSGQPWLSSYFSLGTYQGYQRWTVPATANYTIEAGGAAGGDGSFADGVGYNGGAVSITRAYGALISGTFSLTAGHVIEMVVGLEGGRSGGPYGNENGGGGATWVKNITTDTLLLVAGGAGGAPGVSYGASATRNISAGHGQATTTPGLANGAIGGGHTFTRATGGNGGVTSSDSSYHGGMGGGYISGGANGGTHCSLSYGGLSYSGGLIGGPGNTCYNVYNYGGFGGGGGGQLGTPGAGGGYNGGSTAGSWSSYSDYGGGGGSYNIGSNQTNTTGGNTGSLGGRTGTGYCKITII
jgi:hypothetical protein